MRRKKRPPVLIGITIIMVLCFSFLFISMDFNPPEQSAKETVDKFYSHEQEGNFAESWNLFHPLMKEKWNKSTYLQDRVHVFIGHFGAETFKYHIKEIGKLKDWRITKETPSEKEAYKFQVTQTYKGKYGKFSFEQEVYVINNKGKWQIAWDYNE
ncbi:hypothetical protein D0469_09180 [Peribacillus saganii]|uniref:DUF4878 domain-containing protein n=1 Tax=Peribacillus saganii TaxID=2303992 RepID=A0A372LQC7_9BACI|nr:hypothetical protein [Peribacillus saganii]RFU69528.1 hypothetical protein D0469_09180 [Peribacillus saganii]